MKIRKKKILVFYVDNERFDVIYLKWKFVDLIR